MAETWPAKDPQAVLDYLYTIPLDEGDTVASYTLVKLSGDVVLDSHARIGAEVRAWLSGGTDGETAVFRIDWVTAAGREDDDLITIAISDDPDELLLTGFAKPSEAHLVARYPAFADVATATIRIWLRDAERHVTTEWAEGDYAAGLMSLAAHNMALAGLGDGAGMAGIPAGVTSFRSGSFQASFSDVAANARLAGSYGSTRYGAEYLALLRRNRAGPRVMPTGTVPYDPYMRFPQGEA